MPSRTSTRRRKNVVLLLPSLYGPSTSSLGESSTAAAAAAAAAAVGGSSGASAKVDGDGDRNKDTMYAPYGYPGVQPSHLSAAARLDILLYAQQSAWLERGEVVDIQSLMTPDMRLEWFRRNAPYYVQPHPSSNPYGHAPVMPGYPNGHALDPQSSHAPPLLPSAIPGRLPLASGPPDTTVDLPVVATTAVKHSQSASGEPESLSHSTLNRKKRPPPGSAAEHWKHCKRAALAQQEVERLAAVQGAAGDDDKNKASGLSGVTSLPTFTITPAASHVPATHKKPLDTPIDEKAGIRQTASYWNHLLIQARKARGPQWNYSTQSHQVDQHSEYYYSHMGKLNPKFAEENSGMDGGKAAGEATAADDADRKPSEALPDGTQDPAGETNGSGESRRRMSNARETSQRPSSSSGGPRPESSAFPPPAMPNRTQSSASHHSRSAAGNTNNMQRTPSGPGKSVSLDSPHALGPPPLPDSAGPQAPNRSGGGGGSDAGRGSVPPASASPMPPQMAGSNGHPNGGNLQNQADQLRQFQQAATQNSAGAGMPFPNGQMPTLQQMQNSGFSPAQLQGLMQQAQASGMNPAMLFAQVQAQARQGMSGPGGAGPAPPPGPSRHPSDPPRPPSSGKGGAGGGGQHQPGFGNVDFTKLSQMNGRHFGQPSGPGAQLGGGLPGGPAGVGLGANGINPALLAQLNAGGGSGGSGVGGGPGGGGGLMGRAGPPGRGYGPGQQGQWPFGNAQQQ